jgi:predicted nucleotidyltransferase
MGIERQQKRRRNAAIDISNISGFSEVILSPLSVVLSHNEPLSILLPTVPGINTIHLLHWQALKHFDVLTL